MGLDIREASLTFDLCDDLVEDIISFIHNKFKQLMRRSLQLLAEERVSTSKKYLPHINASKQKFGTKRVNNIQNKNMKCIFMTTMKKNECIFMTTMNSI